MAVRAFYFIKCPQDLWTFYLLHLTRSTIFWPLLKTTGSDLTSNSNETPKSTTFYNGVVFNIATILAFFGSVSVHGLFIWQEVATLFWVEPLTTPPSSILLSGYLLSILAFIFSIFNAILV